MLQHETYEVDYFDTDGTWTGCEPIEIDVDIDFEGGLAKAMRSRATALRSKLWRRKHKTNLLALVMDDDRLGAPILQLSCDNRANVLQIA